MKRLAKAIQYLKRRQRVHQEWLATLAPNVTKQERRRWQESLSTAL